ncbi:DedA family protein [Rossellomorea aquimaris]|uniref:DedA family protein n=1 Tax=Rossellomorea aquimaris TaxID=189382 RepID=UPI0007D0778B|nr:DedA family protein [Rossellomorea aquimaris]
MEFLLHLVDQFGYIAMFLFSWIVFLGLPVPNELAAAFSGYLSEWRHFNPYTSFIFMYSGLVSYGIFGFIVGKYFGTKLLYKYFKGKKTRNMVTNGEKWIEKYGLLAISFSYFIPGIRLFMPYIAGTSKGISLLKFLLYALPSAFAWATIYFQIGRLFPRSFQTLIEELSVKAGIIFSVVLLMVFLYSLINKLNKKTNHGMRVRYRKIK